MMKVFIAGARRISKLNKKIKKRLQNIEKNELIVFVGDANGVDKAIQKYFMETNYKNVLVHAVNGKARNNLGNWEINNIKIERKTKDFLYYTAKDMVMAKEADYGFMIWNGKSKGTLNNIINLAIMEKKVVIFFTPEKKFFNIQDLDEFKSLLEKCSEKTIKLFDNLLEQKKKEKEQIKFDF